MTKLNSRHLHGVADEQLMEAGSPTNFALRPRGEELTTGMRVRFLVELRNVKGGLAIKRRARYGRPATISAGLGLSITAVAANNGRTKKVGEV